MSALKRQTEKQIKREIRYISSFFTYDITRFHNQGLIYLQAVLHREAVRPLQLDSSLRTRIINLLTGLELLSIGTSFHGFNKYGTNMAGTIDLPGESAGYTLDLLFGDIFYSRAVIYLLRYRDHSVFDRILEALKKLHESRLVLHIRIQKVLAKKKQPASIDEDRELLINANRLLYVAFELGNCFSGGDGGEREHERNLRITDNLIIYKTYAELLKYMRDLGSLSLSKAIQGHLESGIERTGKCLEDMTSVSEETVTGHAVSSIKESLDGR